MSEKETHIEISASVNKPKAYKGTEPYLFISYARDDSDIVLPIIEQLQSRGVHLWYDEGIEPGSPNFEKAISGHIQNCSVFVPMLTANFYRSDYCPGEIRLAKRKGKTILPLILDDTEISDDLFLLFGTYQGIEKYKMDDDAFYQKFLGTECVKPCIAEPAATSEPNPEKASQGKMPQIITNSVPTHPSVHFQGRETALQEIKALANKKIVLLNGIGGIGKTEICRHIFWDYYSNLTDDIEYLGWIFYESSLATSLFNKFDLIKELDPERYQEAVRQMVNDCHFRKKLLLFVDNANELTAKEADWLNKLPCRMILTSRSKIESFPQYPIDTLPPDQCRSVYQQNSEDNNPESIPFIDEIIRLAAYHTQTVELLAKTQAASCITAEKLLNELNKHGFTLKDVLETVDSSHAGASSNQRLIEHLAMIFDIAQIRDDEAMRILKLFSLLATNTPIEAKTLKDWLQIKNLNAVNDLVRHGWLNKSDKSFSIHPVIAETVQYKCKPDYAFAETLIEKLTDALNDSKGKGVAVQNALLPHCVSVEKAFHDKKTNSFARFLDRIALIIQETGDYARALTYFKDAVNAAEKANGTDHSDTATTYNNIGFLYRLQGKYDRALKYHERAMAISEKVLGTEHPDTATTYNDIASVYQAMGDFNKALEYNLKALAIREKVLGTEHSDTATTYHNIAGVYQDMGDYDMALEYYNKVLPVKEKVLGTEHPDTATAYNNIAGVYQDMGDYDKALEYHKKALAISEKVLGKEHPDTATTYNNIASVYQDMGDLDKALEYYNKALPIYEKVLGTEHPDTASTYHNIAGVYQDMGDYDMALEYYEKALEIREKVLGTEHPYTASTYIGIGSVYQAMGDYDMALEYNLKAMEIREKVLGSEHPDTATTYNNIAGVYQDMGDYDMALEYYNKALPIYEKVLGTEHPSTATTYNGLAVVYKAMGEYDKALEYNLKAMEIREKVLGTEHPSTATTYNNIAGVYQDMGDNDKALEYAHKAEHIWESVFGAEHPNTRNIYTLLVMLYYEKGDMEKALEYIMKAGISLG